MPGLRRGDSLTYFCKSIFRTWREAGGGKQGRQSCDLVICFICPRHVPVAQAEHRASTSKELRNSTYFIWGCFQRPQHNRWDFHPVLLPGCHHRVPAVDPHPCRPTPPLPSGERCSPPVPQGWRSRLSGGPSGLQQTPSKPPSPYGWRNPLPTDGTRFLPPVHPASLLGLQPHPLVACSVLGWMQVLCSDFLKLWRKKAL